MALFVCHTLGPFVVKRDRMSTPQFEEIITKLPQYLQEIRESESIPMNTSAQRRSLRNALPSNEGVYVLYEGDRPVYVGRSDRLADRLLEHGQPGNGPEQATFAFNLAYQEWRPDTHIANVTRQERQAFRLAPEYHSLFDEAKERVRRMHVRTVGINNPVEQAVFELYAHVELKTRYNSFRNH